MEKSIGRNRNKVSPRGLLNFDLSEKEWIEMVRDSKQFQRVKMVPEEKT